MPGSWLKCEDLLFFFWINDGAIFGLGLRKTWDLKTPPQGLGSNPLFSQRIY